MTSRPQPLSERPPGFIYRKQRNKSTLHCEGTPLSKLATKYATPLYVYSWTTINARYAVFDAAFSDIPHTICYSVKANSNLTLLRLLAKKGCGFDVVSGGELERVLIADRKAAKKVVFSGVGKTQEELLAALKAGILIFNVESESELSALADCASRLRKPASIALRVNPDVAAETHPYISTGLHKHNFGVPIGDAKRLYAQAAKSKYLQARGVSAHIGSQITDATPFGEATARMADLIRDLRQGGHNIKYVDAGGGLGISYEKPDFADFPARVKNYARLLSTPLRDLDLHLLLEPGRSIVGPAGILLTKIVYKKSNGGKHFIIVDAAMNDLIRPALYNAHHEIIPVVQTSEARMETADIVGPVCETGDFFARERSLPEVEEGDLLAILDTGAYGMAQASNYNSRPRATEVLVSGKSAKVIRRRETLSDLVRAER
jgi:diaminopimelate decarboxylase